MARRKGNIYFKRRIKLKCSKCKKGKVSVRKIKGLFNSEVIEVITCCLRCGYKRRYNLDDYKKES